MSDQEFRGLVVMPVLPDDRAGLVLALRGAIVAKACRTEHGTWTATPGPIHQVGLRVWWGDLVPDGWDRLRRVLWDEGPVLDEDGDRLIRLFEPSFEECLWVANQVHACDAAREVVVLTRDQQGRLVEAPRFQGR
jgi:hypothetical protein